MPGGDLKSLQQEVKALEAELQQIQNAVPTSKRVEELKKYVSENQSFDPLVMRTQNNPISQSMGADRPCCG